MERLVPKNAKEKNRTETERSRKFDDRPRHTLTGNSLGPVRIYILIVGIRLSV